MKEACPYCSRDVSLYWADWCISSALSYLLQFGPLSGPQFSCIMGTATFGQAVGTNCFHAWMSLIQLPVFNIVWEWDRWDMGKTRNTHNILFGIHQQKRSFGRQRRSCYSWLGIASNCVFVTYYPKIKVGLSNHQSVCLCVCVCVCVCVSPTNNFWTACYKHDNEAYYIKHWKYLDMLIYPSKSRGNYKYHVQQSVTLNSVRMGFICFSMWREIIFLSSVNHLILWLRSVVFCLRYGLDS
jgi:hypothetical protein